MFELRSCIIISSKAQPRLLCGIIIVVHGRKAHGSVSVSAPIAMS